MKKTLTIFFLFITLLAGAQNPYHYTIDKSKGLPSNSVYDIFQDKTGYMWFATDEGLCRYNGTTFKSYFSEKQTSRAGSCIREDKYGRIWYSNFDGYLYYIENDKLNTLAHKTPLGYFKYGIINDFLYAITSVGIEVYQLKNLKLVKQLPIPEENMLFTATMGNKFYVLANVLYEIGPQNVLRKIKLPADFYKYLGHSIIMQETASGMLFVSKLLNTSYLMSGNSFTKLARPKEISYVQNVAYGGNVLWLCNPQGAHKTTINSGVQTFQKSYFHDFNISLVFKDNRNNYWFSTLNKGVLLVPELKNTLLTLQPRPIVIHKNGDQIIASSENECLYRVNLNLYQKNILYCGKSNQTINQLLIDSTENRLIFTTNKFVILNNNTKTKEEAHVAVKDVKIVDNKYYSFAASGYSGLFIRNTMGTSIWDSLYYALKKPEINNFNEAALYKGVNAKATVYNQVNKTIYHATNVGLFYYTPKNRGEIKNVQKSLYVKNLVVHKGIVYGLTTNGKVLAINRLNEVTELAAFKEQQLNFVSKIKVIENGLFVIAESAIYEYNLDQQRIINVVNIGADFEVSDVEVYKDKYVFATAKGMLFQSRYAYKRQVFPAFILENVVVNDRIMDAKLLSELKYYQNNIAINYALLAYTPLEKYPIYYKINSNSWQLLNEQSGSLKFSSLAPGSYKVSFKLITNKEMFSEVTFVINKPFWLSMWFLLTAVLVLGTIIYLFYRHKLKQNNAQNSLLLARLQLEKNLNQSKLKAIKSQMNPHFFYNALNTIQSYILASDKKQAVNYLSKFSVLTRTILQMSESEYINLSEEIKMMGFYLDIEKARFNEGFEYQITKEALADIDKIKIPSLLLQPYVENAIKHGLLHKEGVKKLMITFEKIENGLRVTIDDNGIGRIKSTELNEIKQLKHQSFATEAIQNRITLLNQNSNAKITVNYIDKVGLNNVSLGTTVIIEIPLDIN